MGKGKIDVKKLKELCLSCGIETVWQRYEAQDPHCGFGILGLCCKNCNLGPCRIDPFGEGASLGTCGANADVISARNLARHTAAGSSCHSDHGREIAHTLYLCGAGKATSYQIKDEEKLKRIAIEYGIKVEGRDKNEIAAELGKAMGAEFGSQDKAPVFFKRAPKKQQEIWKKL
ncbi:MAG: carbon monoxide dehydrogenase, partial [Omnitrophica bacterium]|nr:carbon monoxide dehydrogenase [Candidatus Omnitrophota bacterium]